MSIGVVVPVHTLGLCGSIGIVIPVWNLCISIGIVVIHTLMLCRSIGILALCAPWGFVWS